MTDAQKAVKAAKREANKRKAEVRNANFLALCEREGLPAPEQEYKFNAIFETALGRKRAWRFDFAWPEYKVSLEIQGGMFQKNDDDSEGGGHKHAFHVREQFYRYNGAAAHGWSVIQCLPEDLCKPETIMFIGYAMSARGKQS